MENTKKTHNLIVSIGDILTTIDVPKFVNDFNIHDKTMLKILEDLNIYYNEHDFEGNYITSEN